jgi:hypothetical protein
MMEFVMPKKANSIGSAFLSVSILFPVMLGAACGNGMTSTATPVISEEDISTPSPEPDSTGTPQLGEGPDNAGPDPTAVPQPEKGSDDQAYPYPTSEIIAGITWDWDTLSQAAIGSDLWPVTWADDGNLYALWGDGGGFGGDNRIGRVAMGVTRIEGPPESYRGVNVNSGTGAEIATSFQGNGKSIGILSLGGKLYSWVNMENRDAPDHKLAWSDDYGATWEFSEWSFDSEIFTPATFLNFGKDYSGSRDNYVYIYGGKWGTPSREVYLLRVLPRDIEDRSLYQYYSGLDQNGHAIWGDFQSKQSVFYDPNSTETNGGTKAQVMYNPGIGRYILTIWHGGPGSLGVFEGPEPWGPWYTVSYLDNFGGMTSSGEGLSSNFPTKWISQDGLTMWNVFSLYGDGAKEGINRHDRFNLVRVRLALK